MEINRESPLIKRMNSEGLEISDKKIDPKLFTEEEIEKWNKELQESNVDEPTTNENANTNEVIQDNYEQ